MILIDTSAFIEFLNETGSPQDRFISSILANDGEELAITDIILTEVLQGIRDDGLFKEIKESLLAFQLFSLKSPDSYIEAAQLYRRCRKKGYTVRRTADCLIAQAAIENGLELLHKDRDFEFLAKVSNLKLLSI